jgi:hypothetical protein
MSFDGLAARRAGILLFSAVMACGAWAATNDIEFNRDIRPILSENCYVCHGHDKNQRKAKLRLDDRDVAIEKEAIVPSKPETSKLVQHIFSTDPDEIMPPPKTHKTLTATQKDLLKRWIAAGAAYEPHWAYIKPKRFAVPQTRNKKWPHNPIDSFVLRVLEAKNIKPSPEADRAILLRRLSLDLIGTPPTFDEVKAFVNDKRPDAYERQVDRLLASPHFGERMAVPWLDVVRFSDTVGYHGDQNENIFPYRDYVIDSFNRNKPFDQFTMQQLAGDLLPNSTTEDKIATGFNRLNMVTREGGAQPKEYLAKYAGDRVRTVSMAWMGSTMGCCECHDHKYDPFSSKDFYSMEAFFADIKQWGVYSDYGYTPNPDLRGWSNDHPFPPEIEVESPYLEKRIGKLQEQVASATQTAAEKLARGGTKGFDQWCEAARAFLKSCPSGWLTPAPEVTLKLKQKETNAIPAANFNVLQDGVISFTDKARESVKVSFALSNMWVAAVRLEIAPQEVKEQKTTTLRKRNGTAFALTATLKSKDGKTRKLPFYFGDADHKEERYSNGFAIIGVTSLWQISTQADKQTGVWLLDKPFKAEDGDVLEINLGNAAVASARVSVTPFPAGDPLAAGNGKAIAAALAHAPAKRNETEQDLLTRTYLLTTGFDSESLAADRKLQEQIRECRRGWSPTMVTVAWQPVVTRVLARGNWQDESGEIVQPATPHFLPPLPHDGTNRLTRLDLARWLVWKENPLTARTVVNRLWKQFFGTGISAVVDDLGAQGEWPVHPELLDWLACEFMEPKVSSGSISAHAWDVKHMVRLMVTSAAYRQVSNERPELKEIDPNNRLVAFQTPRRLEAEFVRDNALAIAGLLNNDIGGPSVHPYQPPGYYVNLQFPDRDYYAEHDDRQYRRGVYSHWQRTFLHPMLANFDAPGREECVANRNVSNTPQQALTLLNDPTFVEASRVFAANLLSGKPCSEEQRISEAYERALSREPKQKEELSLLEFLKQQRDYYTPHPDEAEKLLKIGIAPPAANIAAPELAAWTQVCRVILNLHETITRY